MIQHETRASAFGGGILEGMKNRELHAISLDQDASVLAESVGIVSPQFRLHNVCREVMNGRQQLQEMLLSTSSNHGTVPLLGQPSLDTIRNNDEGILPRGFPISTDATSSLHHFPWPVLSSSHQSIGGGQDSQPQQKNYAGDLHMLSSLMQEQERRQRQRTIAMLSLKLQLTRSGY
eukprot:CAMPEP_0117057586 /NCGR_PEP_ID=MMETSP0472-20121206/40002_1 /TAXON_ID=693140 ORGANISM="Tiarina fusus, Strain LIS" /NCGR_SAMPLE_ID=MMETSP0472 /ASSEMBLY_ACC=CAM_ASM_000603 /LENGTH=175 /DNA_ID=CAMNT_0004774575 /DNA_START=293 /DNA_END=820 /DNA_ORIENTATION=-